MVCAAECHFLTLPVRFLCCRLTSMRCVSVQPGVRPQSAVLQGLGQCFGIPDHCALGVSLNDGCSASPKASLALAAQHASARGPHGPGRPPPRRSVPRRHRSTRARPPQAARPPVRRGPLLAMPTGPTDQGRPSTRPATTRTSAHHQHKSLQPPRHRRSGDPRRPRTQADHRRHHQGLRPLGQAVHLRHADEVGLAGDAVRRHLDHLPDRLTASRGSMAAGGEISPTKVSPGLHQRHNTSGLPTPDPAHWRRRNRTIWSHDRSQAVPRHRHIGSRRNSAYPQAFGIFVGRPSLRLEHGAADISRTRSARFRRAGGQLKLDRLGDPGSLSATPAEKKSSSVTLAWWVTDITFSASILALLRGKTLLSG